MDIKTLMKLDKNIKNQKESKINKSNDDSSIVSSYDDDNVTNADIQKEACDSYVQTELQEKIIKYLKIDNKIKDKQKEVREYMKMMKQQRTEIEKYLIRYLDDINQDYISVNNKDKLTKTVVVSKGAINIDNIKKSVNDGLKKEDIKLDDKKFNEVLLSILEFVDNNRPKKTRTYIKRTGDKPNKKDKPKQRENDSDDELPKYK